MEITYQKMSMSIALITQLLFFYCMDNGTALHLKSIQIGRTFYPKQKNEDNKTKPAGLIYRRSDGNTDENQRSHNLLVIDVSNLQNLDNKKAGFNNKPKLLEIDTSVLSQPLHSIFPELKMLNIHEHGILSSNIDLDDQLFENEQYDEQNDETNEILPLPPDHLNGVAHTFPLAHSSSENAIPYGFPYIHIHNNPKRTSSEKLQESNQNIPLPSISLWPLEKGTDISSNHQLPKLLPIFKKNVLRRKSPHY